MCKHIFTVLLLVFLASFIHSARPFSFSNSFETGGKKVASNVCCLPNIFSLKGTFNQVSTIPNNNTLQTITGDLQIYGDYKNGKLRQNFFYSANGNDYFYYQWEIRYNSTVTISYHWQYDHCSCRAITNFDWNSFCIPNLGKVSKAKIGNYDAVKITNDQVGEKGTTWTFKDQNMVNSDKCWILSSYQYDSTSAQEQTYYDMIEKVDQKELEVSSICPSVTRCLNGF